MNRHHPYSASFEHSPGRRGNSPSLGPDRGHRYPAAGGGPFRGRGGFNRGRGGYGSYDSSMNNHGTFDQGHNQSELGGYDDYDNPPTTQHSYYQNNSYADSTPAHFPPSAAQQMGYSHGYSKFEGALKLRLNEKMAKDRQRKRETSRSSQFIMRVEARGLWQVFLFQGITQLQDFS
jgi:hypothetical protein